VGGAGRFRRYARFASDWAAESDVPQVIFIEPEYTDGPHYSPNDDHSPTGITPGQAFLADIYNTISASNRWAETLMIVMYDEHGGFFDHVSPLPIETDVAGFHFETTGLRVPAFLISPFVAAGGVFSDPLDHTSVLQLLGEKFNAGGVYSAAVSARTQLAKLSSALSGGPKPGRAPDKLVLPIQAHAAVDTTVESPENASLSVQAFRSVTLKVQQDHPELLASPGWQDLAGFIDKNKPVPSPPDTQK